MNEDIKIQKKSIPAVIFGLSIWAIFFMKEGSFSIQSIVVFLLALICFYVICKKNIFKITNDIKVLILFIVILILSTVINSFRHIEVLSVDNVIGILYFIAIFLWYFLTTNHIYNDKDIKFIINNYCYVSTICSLLVLAQSLSGVHGKIAMVNFVGTVTDENFVSAIISMAPIYLFTNILYSDKKLKMNFIINIFMLIINVLGVCVIGSRAGMIGMIISLLATFIIYFMRGMGLKKILYLCLVILFVIFIASYAIKIMPQWIYTRYFGTTYMDNSNTTRLKIWKNALNGIYDQPILGFGMGTFPNLSKYTFTAGKSVPAHETFLDITIYSGLTGLLIFLIFLEKIFKKFILVSNRRLYIPIIFNLIFISLIVGAEKSVFFWNNLIILKILDNYLQQNNDDYRNLMN